ASAAGGGRGQASAARGRRSPGGRGAGARGRAVCRSVRDGGSADGDAGGSRQDSRERAETRQERRAARARVARPVSGRAPPQAVAPTPTRRQRETRSRWT